MATRTVIVGSSGGLHMAPAGKLQAAAKELPVTVSLTVPGGERAARADSMMTVMALKIPYGAEVTLAAEGPEAEAALEALAAVVAMDHDAENRDG